MELIVDIDDKTYETIKNAEPLKWDCPIESAYKAIKNGKPLPKKYGRLIDADELLKNDVGRIMGFRECDIKNAPTVNAIPISVIDDIKAEIQEHTQRYTLARESGGMGQVDWSDRLIKESEVLKILDKYKSESEE